jgi:hypothetical protein
MSKNGEKIKTLEHPQNILKTSLKHPQNILKTSLKHP